MTRNVRFSSLFPFGKRATIGKRAQRTSGKWPIKWPKRQERTTYNPSSLRAIIFSTGDNFYPRGVESFIDPRWDTAFEHVYDSPSLGVPWYITLGNHDHHGDVSAQVRYSSVSSRWRLPSRYYKRSERLGGELVDFFHLDTTPIVSGHPSADLQLRWFERVLARSTASWKIVVGHHPVYSGGKHGSERSLRTLLEPLFKRYNVQVYLNGHDHALQHIEIDGVHYITTGAAASGRRARAIKGTHFVKGETLGFMVGRVTHVGMNIEFVDETGASLYSAFLTKNEWLSQI